MKTFPRDYKMPFGVYEGKLISEVPAQYLLNIRNSMDEPKHRYAHRDLREWIAHNEERLEEIVFAERYAMIQEIMELEATTSNDLEFEYE